MANPNPKINKNLRTDKWTCNTFLQPRSDSKTPVELRLSVGYELRRLMVCLILHREKRSQVKIKIRYIGSGILPPQFVLSSMLEAGRITKQRKEDWRKLSFCHHFTSLSNETPCAPDTRRCSRALQQAERLSKLNHKLIVWNMCKKNLSKDLTIPVLLPDHCSASSI